MKPWWKSKTVWLNMLAASLLALGGVLDAVRERFGPDVFIIVATLLPAANVVMRFVTTQGITARRAPPETKP